MAVKSTGGHAARDYWEDWGLVLLMTAFLAGPIAFGLNLQIGYATVKWACSRDQRFVLTAIAIVMLGVTIAGSWIGWSCYQKLRGASDRGATHADRSYFLAIISIGLNAVIGLWIGLTIVPHFILSPCE